MKEYDEDSWLDGYICKNYPDLLTDFERIGLQALQVKEKADYAAQEGDKLGTSSYAKILRRQTDQNRSAVTKALKTANVERISMILNFGIFY
jgi:hypothetical protein